MVKRLVALLVIFIFVVSLGSAYAADVRSEDADHPMDTPLFLPFYLIDKLLGNYDEERWHRTIEEEMQEEHLKAKAKAGR